MRTLCRTSHSRASQTGVGSRPSDRVTRACQRLSIGLANRSDTESWDIAHCQRLPSVRLDQTFGAPAILKEHGMIIGTSGPSVMAVDKTYQGVCSLACLQRAPSRTRTDSCNRLHVRKRSIRRAGHPTGPSGNFERSLDVPERVKVCVRCGALERADRGAKKWGPAARISLDSSPGRLYPPRLK